MKKIDGFVRPQQPTLLWTVVLIPATSSAFTAAHFHELTVSAENHLGVQSDEAVRAHLAVGWTVGEIIPSGQSSALVRDINARARRAAEDALDPIPADLRGPNSRPPIGVPSFATRTVAASLPPALPSYRRGG